MPAIVDNAHYTPQRDRFTLRLAGLVAFLQASGGRYPSRVLAKDEAERALALFVMNCRGAIRATSGTALTPARRRQLEALPGWTWASAGTPLHQARFRANLEQHVATVEAAARRLKGIRFPRGYRLPDGRNPVTALRRVRTARELDMLPDDLARRLQRLPGWTWKRHTPDPVPGLDGWLKLLDAYIAKHGHTRIPVDYTVGTHKLGRWVSRVRTFARKGRMTDEMADALEARPAWRWNAWEVQVPRPATRSKTARGKATRAAPASSKSKRGKAKPGRTPARPKARR